MSAQEAMFNIKPFLFTQAEQPGFKIWLSFCVFFFLRSGSNRRLGSTAHASLVYAYDTRNLRKLSSCKAIREFKITTTATATGTSLNKRFNEQNNGCARAL